MAYLVPHGGGKALELRHHMLIGTRKDCDVFLNPGSTPPCYLARVHLEDGERWLEVLERGEVHVNGVSSGTLDLEEKAVVDFPSLRLRFWFTTAPPVVEVPIPEPARPEPVRREPPRPEPARPEPARPEPSRPAPVIRERQVSTLWRDRGLEPAEVAETLVVPRSRLRQHLASAQHERSSPDLNLAEPLVPTVALPREPHTVRIDAAAKGTHRAAPAPETLVFVPRASRPPPPLPSPIPPAASPLHSLAPPSEPKPMLPWWGALIAGFLLALGMAFLLGRLR